jgi:hypothetical protein
VPQIATKYKLSNASLDGGGQPGAETRVGV